jgi:phenylacetate-CoA ligase
MAFGIEAELLPCPVRRRYAWQRLRYERPTRQWLRALHAGAAAPPPLARLQDLLLTAQRETGHYPAAFARAGVTATDVAARDDLRHFPTLSRRQHQEHHFDLFSRRVTPLDVEEGWLGQTSGSTGEPVRFFMDGESIHFFLAFIRFLWEHLALGPLPAPRSTGIVLLCALPRSVLYETRLPLFRGTTFRKVHWAEDGVFATLNRLRPAVVTGDPDSLGYLADALESGDVAIRPRLVLSSAFAMPGSLAARLQAATGAAVVDYLSMAETGPLAWKCPRSGRFHALEGAAELESVDGELLVTNLRNRQYPLVRYATGDLARVTREDRCECGFAARDVAGLEGRVTSRFLTQAGQRVDPSRVQPILAALPVRQYQLLQRSAGMVTLRYWADDDLSLPPALGEGLSRLLGGVVTLVPERARGPLFRPGEKRIVYRSDL